MLGIEMIRVPVHREDKGSLIALDRIQHLPFTMQRVFFILACPEGAMRAGHSTSTHLAILAIKGAVTLELDNGGEQTTLHLDSIDQVVCIHAGVWLRLRNLSPSTIIAVAASKLYAETEYFDGPRTELLPSRCASPWS